jgi:hypothetical protein
MEKVDISLDGVRDTNTLTNILLTDLMRKIIWRKILLNASIFPEFSTFS